jgi:serine/threonine-protein kinase RsbW
VLARNPSIREALAEVRSRLGRMALSEEEITTVEVVLAEVMNNVAEHAYAWRRDGEMILGLAHDAGGHPRVGHGRRASDAGRDLPFGERLDPTVPLEDMPEGGFGWLIIRQLARDVSLWPGGRGERAVLPGGRGLAGRLSARRPDRGPRGLPRRDGGSGGAVPCWRAAPGRSGDEARTRRHRKVPGCAGPVPAHRA